MFCFCRFTYSCHGSIMGLHPYSVNTQPEES
jgi:hypothetical protein